MGTTRFDVSDQLDQRLHLVRGRCFDGGGVNDRPPDVAKGLVHGVSKRMNDGRLPASRDYDRGPAMIFEIANQSRGPLRKNSRERRGCTVGLQSEPRGDRARKTLNRTGAERPAVVRDGTRAGNRALDHIQPVHSRVRPRHAPPVGKVARIAKAARARAKEVGIEREDDVRPVEFIDRVDVLTKG